MRSVYDRAYAHACQSAVDSDVLERLREGQYDVVLAYAEQPCHAMIAHLLNIPYIWFDTHGA